MNSRIYKHIKSLPIQEQISYINHVILSNNKSRSNKRHAWNLSSIKNELKQIKEKILLNPLFLWTMWVKSITQLLLKSINIIMTPCQLSSNKYRQINTNKYSILINKHSLIKSLNNAKYELNELLNKLCSIKGTFKCKLWAYIKAIKKNSLNTYTIKISSNYFLANNNL